MGKEIIRNIKYKTPIREIFKEADEGIGRDSTPPEAPPPYNPFGEIIKGDKANDSLGKWGMKFSYVYPPLRALARYALTSVINDFKGGHISHPGFPFTQSCTTATIATDLNKVENVYEDVLCFYDGMMISGVMDDRTGSYLVSLSGETKLKSEKVIKLYNDMLRKKNFFKGKVLTVYEDTIQFSHLDKKEFGDVVVRQGLKDSLKVNCVDFLDRFFVSDNGAEISSRAILLSGLPGTGKSSLVKACASEMNRKGVTIVSLCNTDFLKFQIDFMSEYLTPLLIVLEDLELFASDRNIIRNPHVYSVMNFLDGIEGKKHPVVLLATTNLIENIDVAVRRPCRFDRVFDIPLPIRSELEQIWENKVGKGVKMNLGKHSIEGLTGAHIEEIAISTRILQKSDKTKSYSQCVEMATDEVMECFKVNDGQIGF